MQTVKTLAILFALQALPALATSQLPSTFEGSTTDYITFADNAFPSSNLICFSAGCGGAFQGTVYGPGATDATGPSTLTAVWCTDYQLDVTTGSQYVANITTLNDINAGTESNVRYGTLDSVGTSPGWVNSVTAPNGIDANSSAYRYTLAAALVSQYVDTTAAVDPTNLNGSSPVNTAIQEAMWYITYNNEYQSGATWPPESDITSSPGCTGGQNNVNDPNNYACWVKYAEANAATGVNTSAWAVVSGPVGLNGLETPQPLNGIYSNYPAYQTFLVQVSPPSGQITHENPTPEPGYFALTFGLGGLILLARSRRVRKHV